MSTEHQQYSLDNQAAAIQEYASEHGFIIVRTYEDPGRSGLLLKHRPGLQRLLSDVVNGKPDYAAILVYDVSRWGRFADSDEAAHYEFLCKHAGTPVHYCAEPFANDGSVSSSILKALKRTMAAEYSRELGVKTYAGKKRLVQLGFRVGGQAGYGLRRMLLSADGTRKQILRNGERKSLMTDRVILVPGPKKEVKCVRLMFQMALRKPYMEIVRDLNDRGTPYLQGKCWTIDRVKDVLTNPKYAGCNVWGRTAQKLRSRTRPTDPEQWVVMPRAFKPVVDRQTFDRVQTVHRRRSFPMPDEVLLEKLRGLLASVGNLSQSILAHSPGVPHPTTYIGHFGSLRRAFELVGYRLPSRQLGISNQCRRRRHLQRVLIAEIERLFPNQARVPFVRNRPVFRLDDGTTVPMRICYCFETPGRKQIRWFLTVPRRNRHLATLICLCNRTNDGFEGFHIVWGIEIGTKYTIQGEDDPLLQRGHRLDGLSELPAAAQTFATSGGQPAKLSDEAHLFGLCARI